MISRFVNRVRNWSQGPYAFANAAVSLAVFEAGLIVTDYLRGDGGDMAVEYIAGAVVCVLLLAMAHEDVRRSVRS